MNTLTETLFTVLEAVGTVAFAVSGATVWPCKEDWMSLALCCWG